jgi:hypothetical protein
LSKATGFLISLKNKEAEIETNSEAKWFIDNGNRSKTINKERRGHNEGCKNS